MDDCMDVGNIRGQLTDKILTPTNRLTNAISAKLPLNDKKTLCIVFVNLAKQTDFPSTNITNFFAFKV